MTDTITDDELRLIKEHQLYWLFSDSIGLFNFGRRYSCLLLLLCAIDALAKRKFPQLGVKERFTKHLKENLPKQTRVENFNIRIPKKNCMLRLEEVLYQYLRNPMVHEGASLDIKTTTGAHVVLYWGSDKRYVKVDDDTVTLGGNGVILVLFGVVHDGIKADMV